MKQFKNRKFLLLLLLFAIIFAACVLVPNCTGLKISALCAILVIVCALLGGIREFNAKNLFFVFLALATAFSSIVYSTSVKSKNKNTLSYVDGEVHTIRAEITLVSYVSAYDSSYHVDILEADGKSVNFSAVLDIADNDAFSYGDIIVCDVTFEAAEEETAYLRGKNIFLRASSDGARKSGKAEKDIAFYLQTANNYLCGHMVDLLGKDTGGFCAALILGNRKYVDSGLRLDFSRVGISHLLALSGLHLSVIAQTLNFLLRGFMKKKPRNIVLLFAVFAFALFTGLSVSVLRAAVMLTFVFVADMVGEENDSLTALFAAVCVIFIVNGNAVYDVAFWLSCSATLGIILVRPAADALFAKWQKTKKKKLLRIIHSVCKYFYGILIMTLAATLFTLPVIYFVFCEISLIGVFSNFVFLPLASVLLVLCVFFVPLSFVPYITDIMVFLCGSLADFLILLAEKISDLRGIYVSLNYPFASYIFAILAVMLFICIFVRELRFRKIGAIALLFVISFSGCFGIYKNMTAGDVRVTVSCEGTRDFVSVSADEKNYVFDISMGGYSFMYGEIASIKEFADTEVDNLVLTHYHIYHENSIYRLKDAVKIRKILLPVPETEAEAEIFINIKSLLERIAIPYEVYTRGEIFYDGEVSIDFAPLRNISRSVKPIVAFELIYGNKTFSYIESVAFETDFDYSAYLEADNVFVGGHGPKRKLSVSAKPLQAAGKVIFADGMHEFFYDAECLPNAHNIEDYGGEMSFLCKE